MRRARTKDLPEIHDAFVDADLGDVRRTKRLQLVAARADANPDAGFPQMVASDSELEGVYRLLGNEEVSPDEVLAPRIEATLARAEATRTCVVIHDTTAFSFGGHARRAGLGMLAGNGDEQGFFAHVSRAVLADEARTPRGVCATPSQAARAHGGLEGAHRAAERSRCGLRRSRRGRGGSSTHRPGTRAPRTPRCTSARTCTPASMSPLMTTSRGTRLCRYLRCAPWRDPPAAV